MPVANAACPRGRVRDAAIAMGDAELPTAMPRPRRQTRAAKPKRRSGVSRRERALRIGRPDVRHARDSRRSVQLLATGPRFATKWRQTHEIEALCGRTVRTGLKTPLYGFFYHILFFIFKINYLLTVFDRDS